MGARLVVRLTPRAAYDRIDGIANRAGELVVNARVRAVPEKGKANAALEALLAAALGVANSAVHVVAGGTSRVKTVEFDTDETAADLRTRLSAPISQT